MVVPKKKRSRSRRGARRAHDKIIPSGWTLCSVTGDIVPPHRVSAAGWYKGEKIFKTKEERKAQAAS